MMMILVANMVSYTLLNIFFYFLSNWLSQILGLGVPKRSKNAPKRVKSPYFLNKNGWNCDFLS
jgi:hypothetical protein